MLGQILLSVIFAFGSLTDAANILLMTPMPTKSHYHLFDKLAIELTRRGHDITLISPYKQPRAVPGLTEVVVENVYDQLMGGVFGKDNEDKSLGSKQMSPWWMNIFLPKMGRILSEKLLESSAMKEFLREDHKFDLLISESFLVESVFAGISHKYRVPVVIISPFLANYWSNFMVGNPSPPSHVPDPLLGYPERMTFFERLVNTVYVLVEEINFQLFYLPSQDALMRKHFGADLPPIGDIVRNTSMVLVNHHHSLAFPRPYVPNMVEIGGYHVPPPVPLPQDLKKYMDESKNGVIFFSLGSHLKSVDMPEDFIESIVRAFSRLKENVLWKYEGDSLPNLPKNVRIAKWLPQSDLLAHPNLKLFITHGGLLSTTEAVIRGVPLVGIPIMGDQPVNMKYASRAGIGVTIQLTEVNENTLYAAVQEVLNNPQYRENVKEKSKLLSDRPMNGMETAVYWIEYVIRWKGAPHLRSAAQHLTWYQLHMVDVFGALSAAALLVVYIVFRLTRCASSKLLSLITGRKTWGMGTTTGKKKKN